MSTVTNVITGHVADLIRKRSQRDGEVKITESIEPYSYGGCPTCGPEYYTELDIWVYVGGAKVWSTTVSDQSPLVELNDWLNEETN